MDEMKELELIEDTRSLEDLIEEGYPFFPFVIPLVPLLLLGTFVYVAWRYLDRITTSIERQEQLLRQLVTDVRRMS